MSNSEHYRALGGVLARFGEILIEVRRGRHKCRPYSAHSGECGAGAVAAMPASAVVLHTDHDDAGVAPVGS